MGLHLAFRHNPVLVVLDVMLPKLDGFSVARRLRQTPLTRNIGILILTAKGQIADKVVGFEAGADDYVIKPFDPAELELRVRILLQRTTAKQGASAGTDSSALQGRVVSVFSLRGGVGKTSLAVNLAVTLGQMWPRPVPLLDLSLQQGHIPILLSLRPRATLDDLVDHWREVMDAEALDDYLTRQGEWVRVLAAPRHPAEAERISPEMLQHLLKVLRVWAPVTITDLASQLSDAMLAVLDASDLVLLMMSPEVASVHTTVQTLDTFNALNYPKDKVRVIVNYTNTRRALTLAQIESAIGVPVSLAVPNDPDFFVEAVNTGAPYVLLNPSGQGTRALQDFAYQLGQTLSINVAELTPLAKAVQARQKSK
jgi:pilus assembly protein CpaE